VLNSSGGPPLETLPPLEAREVLVNAQASATVDLSGIEESEKTITADGYTIKLNVVRPQGVKDRLPVFIFVGNSVGGNMTAVTALKAKEQGGPEIKLHIMMWPVTDANFERQSFTQFGEKRFLTTPLMKWMWDLYTTDPKQRKEIYASPLQATINQLKGLPPALIQLAESDILRDEGEAYGRKLDEAGVKVTTVRYDGMIHDFGLLNGLAEEPAVRSLFEHAAAELKKHMQTDGDNRTASA